MFPDVPLLRPMPQRSRAAHLPLHVVLVDGRTAACGATRRAGGAGRGAARAFDLTMQDKDFLAEAAKLRLDVEPVAAAELQALVAEIARTPAEDIAVIQAAHSTGKFFNCKEIVKDAKLCEGKGEAE